MMDVKWIQTPEPNRNIDLNWMVKNDAAIRSMFEPPPPPPPPPSMEIQTPQAPPAPPQPPGPSPEEQRLIAECRQLVHVAADAIAELQEATRLELGHTAELITEIGLTVAEELAAGAIDVDEKRLIDLITQALELLNAEREVKVYLNPVLYERLLESGQIEPLRKAHHLTIRPDARVADRGCIVESPVGQVDARIKSRLRQLRHLISEKQGTQETT